MDKILKVQLQNSEGEVLKDQEIRVNDQDLIIVKAPEHFTGEQIHQIMMGLVQGLQTGGLAVVPSELEFVLVKKENQSAIQTAPKGLILA